MRTTGIISWVSGLIALVLLGATPAPSTHAQEDAATRLVAWYDDDDDDDDHEEYYKKLRERQQDYYEDLRERREEYYEDLRERQEDYDEDLRDAQRRAARHAHRHGSYPQGPLVPWGYDLPRPALTPNPPVFYQSLPPVPYGTTPYYAPEGQAAPYRTTPYGYALEGQAAPYRTTPYGYPDAGGVQPHFGPFRGPGLPR